MPRTERALVLLRERAGQNPSLSLHVPSAGKRKRASNRVLLLGHRGRAPGSGFGHLADLGLAHEPHVQGDLRNRPGSDGERPS